MAELGTAVGAGLRFDVGNRLVVEAPEGISVFASVEFIAQCLGGGAFGGGPAHRGGEDVNRAWREVVAVAGGGGVADDADPVVVAPTCHPDVEMLAAGGAIGEEHSAVDSDPFGFVDGDGVGEGEMLGAVLRREHDAAVAVEVGDDQGAVVAAGVDVPAVAVADPEPAGGDETTIVAGGDDLVAAADDLGADGQAVGFDGAVGDLFGPRPESEGNLSCSHCPAGHPYDANNTYVSRQGWRSCRTCKRLSDRRRRARTAKNLTPEERILQARMGAYRLHALYDPKETTKKARAAFVARFDRQVDPDGVLSPAERARRADAARRAYFTDLQLRSSRARRLR